VWHFCSVRLISVSRYSAPLGFGLTETQDRAGIDRDRRLNDAVRRAGDRRKLEEV